MGEGRGNPGVCTWTSTRCDLGAIGIGANGDGFAGGGHTAQVPNNWKCLPASGVDKHLGTCFSA
jgi:hypothetical protein